MDMMQNGKFSKSLQYATHIAHMLSLFHHEVVRGCLSNTLLLKTHKLSIHSISMECNKMKHCENDTSKALMCETMKLKHAFTCIVEYTY